MGEVKRYDPNYAAMSPADDLAVEAEDGMFVMATDYATLEAENAKLRAELERTATWIEELPVPTVGAAGQLVRIDKVLAAAPSAPKADDPVKAQMLEALDTARDYVYSELENRKSALAGHPNKWEKEERDLAQVDAAIAAARGQRRDPKDT